MQVLTWRLDYWTDEDAPYGGLNFRDDTGLDYWINPPLEFLMGGSTTAAEVDSISIGDSVNIQAEIAAPDDSMALPDEATGSFTHYRESDDLVFLAQDPFNLIKIFGAIPVESINIKDIIVKEIHINFNDSFSFNDQSAPVVDRGVDSMITMNDVISFNLSNISPQIVGVEELI